MGYEQKISKANPGLIAILMDDSGSMTDTLPGTTDARFKWVERYFGIILKELLGRCTELDGDRHAIKARYFLSCVLYGSYTQRWGAELMDIQAAVQKYTDEGNSLGLGGRLGGTDARAAFEAALSTITSAVQQDRFKNAFPPMLFHLTDGQSWTDAAPEAEKIRQLGSNDGNVLIVNAFIGTQTSLNYAGPEDFPGYLDETEAGPSDDNVKLFNMSSAAPDAIHRNLVDDGIFPALRPGSRLFFDVRTKEMLKHVIQVVGSLGSRADRQQR